MGQVFVYRRPDQWLTEGQTWRPPETIVVRDEVGTVLAGSSLQTCTLTLYDPTVPTYPIINGVDHTSILNVDRATISAQGVLVLTLTPADTAIIDPARRYEMRRALIEYTWASGAKADAIEITFYVRNLMRRPAT